MTEPTIEEFPLDAEPGEPSEVRVTSGLAPTPARALQTVEIPIGDIDYNKDNFNRQDEKTFQAEMDSILLYGFVDPCLLRPYESEETAEDDTLTGRYEMIDGEHRVRAMYTFKELGLPPGAHPELVDLVERWVVPCILRPMTKPWANKLLAIMAETRGRGDTVRRTQLFAGLATTMAIEDLIKGLPYEAREMEELIKVGQFDWDKYEEDQKEKEDDAAEDDKTELFKLVLTGPDEFLSAIIDTLKKLRKERGWTGLKWVEKK